MILGITGTYCAGKDTAARILEKEGYIHISISDIIKQYCIIEKKEPTRENLTLIGNKMRQEFGAGIFGKLARDYCEPTKNYIVTSIRNPSEVTELRKAPNFYLIKLDAPLDIRYERFMSRRDLVKDKTITTKQEFIKREESEKSQDSKGLQLHKVFELADTTINNDKEEKTLEKQLKELIKNIQTK